MLNLSRAATSRISLETKVEQADRLEAEVLELLNEVHEKMQKLPAMLTEVFTHLANRETKSADERASALH